jgi:2-amino-4-hydroxy-6-hydroxymethyldihydropteridine diphosphokinase
VEGAGGGLRAFLGLGSNVGDRLANLRAAVGALDGRGVRVAARSSVYETEPQGEVRDQPDFLNACVEVETTLDPEELLDACKAVERDLGREAGGVRHGPRPIDIDLLLLGDIEYESDRLALPHRDLLARRFVLAPLVELDPDLALPDGTRLADALERLEGQRVERVDEL